MKLSIKLDNELFKPFPAGKPGKGSQTYKTETIKSYTLKSITL